MERSIESLAIYRHWVKTTTRDSDPISGALTSTQTSCRQALQLKSSGQPPHEASLCHECLNLHCSMKRNASPHVFESICLHIVVRSIVGMAHFTRATLAEKANDEHIVTGDFNLHHPKWGGDEVRADAEAYELVVLTKEFSLKRTLPRGTITWRQGSRQSTIDLTFVTQLLRESALSSAALRRT
jgi:hypothetical protein